MNDVPGNSVAEPEKKSPRERFFAIDAHCWPKVCELGMAAAIAYLVLACGSGGDQTTTYWSIDAVERHTGIGRPRAKAAVQALAQAGLIKIERAGTRPKYRIIHGHLLAASPPDLTEEERRILDVIKAHRPTSVPKIGRYDNVWKHGRPYETALALTSKGCLRDLGGYRFEAIEPGMLSEAPDFVWLPSSLIESADEHPITPVEKIRQSHNVRALRLLIDLYRTHNLVHEPGIDWRPPRGLRQNYERVKLGEWGEYIVWGFKPSSEEVWTAMPFCASHVDHADKDAPARKFWDALEILTSLRLVEPVPHLVDSDSIDGEVMWPVTLNAGEPCERAVGDAAQKAASRMLTSGQVEWGREQGIAAASPVMRHIKEVQAVGIYRLRHRPHTEATRIWLSELARQCDDAVERMRELASKASREEQDPFANYARDQGGSTEVQHQGGIKGASR